MRNKTFLNLTYIPSKSTTHTSHNTDLCYKTMAQQCDLHTHRHTEQVCDSEGHKAGVLIWRADNMMVSGQRDGRLKDRDREMKRE